jgi:hypothetical protein
MRPLDPSVSGVFSLAEAAARFAAPAADIEAAKHAALEEARKIVEKRAKGLIGHPDDHWLPLQPETIARKDGVNTPSLETREMRHSLDALPVLISFLLRLVAWTGKGCFGFSLKRKPSGP